jgi:hypothetical protein
MIKMKWRVKSGAIFSIFSTVPRAILVLIGVLLFQNCAAPVTASDSSSATTSSTAIQVTSYPSNQVVALGQSLSVSISAYSASGLGLSYQWYKNGAILSGFTGNTLSITSATSSDEATYYVQISDGITATTSGSFYIQVGSTSSTIAISTGPASQSVAPGALTRFEVIASTTTGTLTYQWLKNGVAISGQTGRELYIYSTTSSDAGYYAVDLSNGSTTVRSSTVLLTVAATAASCSALGGSLYGGHCYIVNRTATTWAAAQSTCKSSGGNLAIVNNGSENYYIYSITQTAVWMGANDNATEGSFVWADGTAMSFSAFAAGEPNGGTSENCIQMTPTGYWNDLSCSESRAFVCEI